MLRSIDEGGSHASLLSVAKVRISETAAFLWNRLKDFANDRREADGSELPWVCCAGLSAIILWRGSKIITFGIP